MSVKNWLLLACALLAGPVLGEVAQAAPPTRFEAEIVNAPPTTADSVGYDMISNYWQAYSEPGNSNGTVIYTSIPNAKMKLLFNGTGVNLILRKAGNGGLLSWKLDDGVSSGTVDNYATTLTHQVSVPLASGLPATLHTLEINCDLPTTGTAIFIDGFDVIDSAPRYRFDENNANITKPGWSGDTSLDAPNQAAGGSICYTIAAGTTATIQFVGKAIAINTVCRQDSLAFQWSIDGGARTGTFNPQPIASEGLFAAGGIWYRWPFVLANDLADTTHTVTLTAINGPSGTNFIACLDAVDFASDVYVDTTPTRFELENTDHSINNPKDLFSINFTANLWGLFPEAGTSGGSLIFTTVGTLAPIKMLFYGTGVDVIGETWADHGTFDWSLDEGAQTGSADVFDSGAITQQLRVPIVSGLPRTLHTLTITPTGGIIRLDAIDVYGAGPISRVDDGNRAIIDYQPGVNWEHNDTTNQVDTEAVNGTISYSLFLGDTAEFSFDGTAVALRGRAFNDAFTIGWSIDEGAYTGTLDFATASIGQGSIMYRWPFVLKNDLPAGEHKVTLTLLDSAGGFVGILDSLEIVGQPLTFVNSVEHWTQFE